MLENAEREHIIGSHPFFSLLSKEDVASLALLIEEISIPKGQIITIEIDTIEAIYLIASGTAEVTRTADASEKEGNLVVAKLSPGEAIGLMETGIFSQTGLRTATVTALTDMHLLKIELQALYDFMQNPQRSYKNFTEAAKFILKINFINHIFPFSKLKKPSLALLLENIQTKIVSAGEYIFYQDSVGDACYLLQKGEVEILRNKGDKEELVCCLYAPEVFGETALLTMSKFRNASTRAKVESVLMVISREILLRILQQEEHAIKALKVVVQLRSRPKKLDNVVVEKPNLSGKNEVVILENTSTHQYLSLSELEWLIWQKLDGEHDVQSIINRYADQFNKERESIETFILKLAQMKMIEVPQINLGTSLMTNQSWLGRILNVLRKKI